MNDVAVRRSPVIRSDQLAMLTRQLRVNAGIKIDSSQAVIANCIQERMACLGVSEIESYLAAFDDSINARAEWLALIDLLTVKETRFFRQPAAYECMADYISTLVNCGPTPSEMSFWSAGCSNGHELYSMAMVMELVMAMVMEMAMEMVMAII